ncbi:hypothetical protein C2G38_2164607 [Gigaspora rosea]|uniref:Uncharacterized protein n=1 Tax=Gigaspora rosea TaxID=44941 RepID=A0A397VW26_9GLOM|nr:hypothetical protein C2G38_2164607 [Gigaspora rosea]
MDKFEVEGTVISKRYGVKDAENPKKQAILLGVTSTIMPILLTKYPDLLAIDSTGHCNSLNFPNTAFMVRSNEPRGRVVATFVSVKETISVINLMFESLAMDKWDPYLTVARKYSPNTQVILCDWSEADALNEWFTKNLNNQWLRDRVFYQFRFVKRSQDQKEFDQQKTTFLDAKKLQAATGIAKLAIAETIVLYFRKYRYNTWPDYKRNDCPMKTNMLLEKIDQDAWNVFRFCTNVDTQYIEMDDVSKKNFESKISDSIDEYNKTLYVTHRNRKFACSYSFNVIRGHDCQDIVAVQLFINKPELQNTFDSYNKSDKSAAKSAASCSLESYLHQKDTNSHNKNELKLPEKRVKIVEIIGKSGVIVDIIFENGSQNRCIVQLDDIIGYANEQIKTKSKVMQL